eukprot:INCI16165.2.p1 GENE.INCI16165.2~~INCI16165.2.p1  ORF type:complete len:545 (-),score=105.61 INCI16165.2:915-2549(-)
MQLARGAYLVAALSLLLAACAEAASDEANPVVTLTDADFEDGKMTSTEFALVEFFAPWCGHCKKLEPEFRSAAEQLHGYSPKVLFAAVDATTEKVESSRQAVRGFPTLKWYVRGVAVDFTGERNARSIVNWVKKKTGLPAEELSDQAAVDAFVLKHRVGIVAYLAAGQADDETALFATARSLDIVPFAFTRNAALRNDLIAAAEQDSNEAGSPKSTSSSAMVVFKKPSAGFKFNSTAFTETFTEEAVTRFVQIELLPRVVEFTEAGMSDIFNGYLQTHLVFFGHFNNDDATRSMFDQLARRYRGDFVVVTVGPNELRAMDFFDVTANELPTMRILDLRAEPMYKYRCVGSWDRGERLQLQIRLFHFGGLQFVLVLLAGARYTGALQEEAIVDFVTQFQKGELVPILKSEPVPEQAVAAGEVVKVVGQTFDEVVVNSDHWVLLQIFAPWCGHCKLLDPIWEEVAKSRAHDPRVVVAQIDGTANEHQRLNFIGFPSIQLWGPGGKPVKGYKSHRTLKDLQKFLDTFVGPAPQTATEEEDGSEHDEL